MVSKEEMEAQADAVAEQITGISDKLTDFSGDFTAALKALQDKIDAGGTATDLAPIMSKLTTMGEKLTTISDSLTALDTTAEGTSGQPTPPVA